MKSLILFKTMKFTMHCADENLADAFGEDRSLKDTYANALSKKLSGLWHLHECGYYHCDLKPDNFLIFTRPSGEAKYKISDLVLSPPGAGQTSTLTGSNTGAGTLLYRAPECAVDLKRATHLADTYAVGAILDDIFGNGATRTPHLELTLPGLMGEVISSCTKIKARRRLQSVDEVSASLFQAVKETDVTSTSKEEEIVLLQKATTDSTIERLGQYI